MALLVSARIGYEHLLMEIYKQLNQKVYIEESADMGFSFISELSRCICSNEMSSRISLRLKGNREENKPNVLNIKISAMFWADWKKGDEIVLREDKSNIRICYSTHSSFSEIQDLLSYLKPVKTNLNVDGAGKIDPQRIQMRKELADIEAKYTQKTDSCCKAKRFRFDLAREAAQQHSAKKKVLKHRYNR